MLLSLVSLFYNLIISYIFTTQIINSLTLFTQVNSTTTKNNTTKNKIIDKGKNKIIKYKLDNNLLKDILETLPQNKIILMLHSKQLKKKKFNSSNNKSQINYIATKKDPNNLTFTLIQSLYDNSSNNSSYNSDKLNNLDDLHFKDNLENHFKKIEQEIENHFNLINKNHNIFSNSNIFNKNSIFDDINIFNKNSIFDNNLLSNTDNLKNNSRLKDSNFYYSTSSSSSNYSNSDYRNVSNLSILDILNVFNDFSSRYKEPIFYAIDIIDEFKINDILDILVNNY